MINKIKISEISNYALTEEDGIKLRNKMNEYLKDGQKVVLDFTNITLFATPFFNASVGYSFYNLKETKYNELISVENITQLGMSTYQHSIENAKKRSSISDEQIGEITKDTLSEK